MLALTKMRQVLAWKDAAEKWKESQNQKIKIKNFWRQNFNIFLYMHCMHIYVGHYIEQQT